LTTGELKGVKGLYELCCDDNFYEWVFPEHGVPPQIAERFICSAPIWYNDSEALTLLEANYDSLDEASSTWKLSAFSAGTRDQRLPHRPYKLFQLVSDDDLVVVKCKIRPVLLISKVSSDWRIPYNTANFLNTWLCLPLFSYKPRHSQQYVIEDQAMKRHHHFYFPPGIPGLDCESVGKLIELQFIPEKNLTLMKKMCESGSPKMNRPFRVSELAFQAILGHVSKNLPRIEITGDTREWYETFSSWVTEEIEKIIK
jgi:hypothetical protein